MEESIFNHPVPIRLRRRYYFPNPIQSQSGLRTLWLSGRLTGLQPNYFPDNLALKTAVDSFVPRLFLAGENVTSLLIFFLMKTYRF